MPSGAPSAESLSDVEKLFGIGERAIGLDVVHHPEFVGPRIGDVQLLLIR